MINNVLEEIKRLRSERANAQADVKKLYIHPTHFNMNTDTKAKRTVNNIENIYGSSEKDREYIKVGESNYKNNLFTGHQVDFDSTVRSASKAASGHSDYVNKFMGIPKGVKILNNDNTLYYEKKLGNKTEFDFAIDHMSSDNTKQAGFQSLLNSIRNKKQSGIKQSVASEVAAAKAAKATTPATASVVVAPAVTTAPSVNVAPAFSKDPETARTNMSKFVKGVNMQENIGKVVDAKIIDEQKEEEKRNLIISFNKLNVEALKELFKSESLPIPKGNKTDLIKQLVKYRKENKAKFTV